MPWVVREAVRDINRAVGRRWHAIDPLLPDPATLPAGCGEPLVVNGDNGRVAGLGVCVHQHIPPQSLNQTWGAAERFTLVPRLPGQDVAAAADQLLTQWRDHLAGDRRRPRARTRPRAWCGRAWTSPACPRCCGTACSRSPSSPPAPGRTGRRRAPRPAYGATIRAAGPADEEQVLDLELRLIRYDMHFGGPVWRQATARLVREEIRGSLARPATWTWLAERNGRAVGLLVAQPPQDAGWIAGMTSRSPAAYLQTMFVDAQERGTGIGAALVRNLHAQARRHGHRGHAAAPQPGQPAVRAVLVPDGLPPAVDQLGGPPGQRAALAVRRLRARLEGGLSSS